MKVITRKKAKILRLNKYFTGKPCKWGHIVERYTRDGNCLKCSYNRSIKWQVENSDKKRYHNNNYMRKNKEKYSKYNAVWRKENIEKRRETGEKWRRNNPDVVKEGKKKSYIKNKFTPLYTLRRVCRRVIISLSNNKSYSSKLYKLNYTPEEYISYLLDPLPQFKDIKSAYTENYHLDHIVPVSFVIKYIENKQLAFKISMDLENLRLIPKLENIRKHAKVGLPIVQETIVLLNTRYNVSMPLL